MTTEKKKKQRGYIAAYIDEGLHARFMEYVKNNGGNISWFVGKAIEEKLDRNEQSN